MYLNIRELIIWPAEPSLHPVAVSFEAGKINVITGWSETGKSSILGIVDYCLGSGRCAIPVGPIRDRVAWYGLRIETSIGLMRIARKRPTDRDVDNDFEVLTHDHAERDIAVRPERNQHVDQFKALMNSLAKLSDLRLSTAEETSGYSNPASFRDMAAFNFLPQHIVANPYTLFFKADTTEHREKLRRVFPLVLGTKTNETLLMEHQLAALEKQERQMALELNKKKAAVETFRSQLTGSYLRAQELNLFPAGEPPSAVDQTLRALTSLVRNPERYFNRPNADTSSPAVRRLENLRLEEEQLDAKLGDAKRHLARVVALDSSVDTFGQALIRQDDRVAAQDWFQRVVTSDHECPMCGSVQDTAAVAVEELGRSVRQLRSLTASAFSARFHLHGEALDAQRKLTELDEELKNVRRKRRAFLAERDADDAATEGGQRLEDAFMFIGEIRNALATVVDVDGTDGLEEQHRNLISRIAYYRRQIDARRQQELEDAAVDSIGELIRDHAQFMALGHNNLKPLLDIKELNLRFRQPDAPRSNKGDLLWEIGSGANWMGYHLAAFLALHEFFGSRGDENPVPNFLIIDQPSQVYFPSDTFKERVEPAELQSRAGDLAKTRRIFELLDRVMRRPNIDLQIVVLEHADERTWEGLNTIKKIRDWRSSGDRLIPTEWL
jgi:hypothetical protein